MKAEHWIQILVGIVILVSWPANNLANRRRHFDHPREKSIRNARLMRSLVRSGATSGFRVMKVI